MEFQFRQIKKPIFEVGDRVEYRHAIQNLGEICAIIAAVDFLRGRLKFEGVDRDGNWINPGMGMGKLLNVPEGAPQLFRSGQNDLMLVIFGVE